MISGKQKWQKTHVEISHGKKNGNKWGNTRVKNKHTSHKNQFPNETRHFMKIDGASPIVLHFVAH